jgi:hypothetical protein
MVHSAMLNACFCLYLCPVIINKAPAIKRKRGAIKQEQGGSQRVKREGDWYQKSDLDEESQDKEKDKDAAFDRWSSPKIAAGWPEGYDDGGYYQDSSGRQDHQVGWLSGKYCRGVKWENVLCALFKRNLARVLHKEYSHCIAQVLGTS